MSPKESACSAGDGVDPWVRKIPWGRKQQPTPVFLPGKSQGWRSLMGYNPRGRKESDTTERLNSNTPEWGHNFLLLCRPCSTVLKTASFKR